MKSTIEEIRERFDNDVERFSNLETGQVAMIDAALSMDLLTSAAAASNPRAATLLDIGCGAGNQTLKLLERLRPAQPAECHLVDLSRPMLDRAVSRVSAVCTSSVRAFQADFREADLPRSHYDIIVAAAVLHHLRDDADWESAFHKIFGLLAPGGSFWVIDMVAHESGCVSGLMRKRFGDYLVQQGGEAYRERVLAYIEKEDSPRSLTYQLDLMRRAGFVEIDVLHKNSCFAVFGGRKVRE